MGRDFCHNIQEEECRWGECFHSVKRAQKKDFTGKLRLVEHNHLCEANFCVKKYFPVSGFEPERSLAQCKGERNESNFKIAGYTKT